MKRFSLFDFDGEQHQPDPHPPAFQADAPPSPVRAQAEVIVDDDDDDDEAAEDEQREASQPPVLLRPTVREQAELENLAAATHPNKKRKRFVSLAKKVLDVAAKDARKASDSLTNSMILQKWEHPLLQGNPLMRTECEGDRLVKLVNDALCYLDANGFERSSQQRLFHRAFMQASYAMFYGKDLHKNLVRLLEESNASELRTEVAITTPRRFGKTFSIALWCAALLVCATGHDSSIYSTSARVSKMLLQTILRFVHILQQKYGGQIVAIDKNEYVEFVTAQGYNNAVYAYPAKSETLRGTGSKRKMGTVVLEEAAFIPPEVTTSIVAPTLTRDNVNLFAISTINSEDVVMKGFMCAKYEDGRSVMLTLNFSLVCSECRATGRVETCQHLLGELPHWSSSAQHKKLAAMMKDSQETLQREIRGMDISENVKPAFELQSVRVLEDDEMSVVAAPMPVQQMIFVTVDPSAGGAGSAMAIVSAVYVQNQCIIVGAEEVGSSSAEERKAALRSHINALRNRPEFSGAMVVVCVESNLASEAEHFSNDLREKRVGNLIIMQEDNDKDGFRTTNDTKKMGVIRLRQLLIDRRVKFYAGLTRVAGKHAENDAKEVRKHIVDQLQTFMCIAKPTKNVWDEPKFYFSGKLSGRDDLAIAVMLMVLIYERFRARREHYLEEGPRMTQLSTRRPRT